jgi:hypothetical protein
MVDAAPPTGVALKVAMAPLLLPLEKLFGLNAGSVVEAAFKYAILIQLLTLIPV